jgi:hypothetical protein
VLKRHTQSESNISREKIKRRVTFLRLEDKDNIYTVNVNQYKIYVFMWCINNGMMKPLTKSIVELPNATICTKAENGTVFLHCIISLRIIFKTWYRVVLTGYCSDLCSTQNAQPYNLVVHLYHFPINFHPIFLLFRVIFERNISQGNNCTRAM